MKHSFLACVAAVCLTSFIAGAAVAQEQPDILKQKSGYPDFYTGEVLPKPQQVLSRWKFIPLEKGKVEIQTDGPAREALPVAQRLIHEKINETIGDGQKPAGKKLNLFIAPLNSALIKFPPTLSRATT